MVILENTKPAYAKLETIRAYERIPEIAYRWKIAIILLFDLLLLYMYLHYDVIDVHRDPGHFLNDFLYILQNGAFSSGGQFDMKAFLFIPVFIGIVFIIIPIICMTVIVYYEPWIFKNFFKVLNLLNPFNHDRDWKKFRSKNLVEYEKEKRDKRKRREKYNLY